MARVSFRLLAEPIVEARVSRGHNNRGATLHGGPSTNRSTEDYPTVGLMPLKTYRSAIRPAGQRKACVYRVVDSAAGRAIGAGPHQRGLRAGMSA
jgi:hypothetical protein